MYGMLNRSAIALIRRPIIKLRSSPSRTQGPAIKNKFPPPTSMLPIEILCMLHLAVNFIDEPQILFGVDADKFVGADQNFNLVPVLERAQLLQ